MKLTSIYGFVFGIFGFPIAFLISQLVMLLVAGGLENFVFKGNPWSDWPRMLLPLVFVTIFCFTELCAISLGVKQGKTYAQYPDQKFVRRKAYKWMSFGIVVMFVYLWIITVGYGSLKSAKMQKDSSVDSTLYARDISSVQIYQENNIIKFDVKVTGTFDGEFELKLNLIPLNYIKSSIVELKTTRLLVTEHQEFKLNISFDELERAYRAGLDDYLQDKNQETDFIENISLEATLTLLDPQHYTGHNTSALAFPQNEIIAMLQFQFSCQKDVCKIIQSEESN